MNLYRSEIPKSSITVTYDVISTANLALAAEAIAIGQSIGNPSVRNEFETPELVENHAAKIIGDQHTLSTSTSGTITIAYPAVNIDWDEDGISQLLCMIQGGQTDIDHIIKCRVTDIDIENIPKLKPKFGLSGIRELTKIYDRPLLGCILKPKTGLSPKDVAAIVKEMVEGGANIIKEDEILGNPSFCKLQDRLEYVRDVIQDKNIVYLTCINADADRVIEKASIVRMLGVNGIHLNIWSGLGTYAALRRKDYPMVLHYQKSGDKVITNKDNPYGIEWSVLCKLAVLSGVDTIHAGMWGGYLSDDPVDLKHTMDLLTSNNIVPALSCGMTAELIPRVTEKFGIDYLANVGGAVHTHPDGIRAAVRILRNAIDG
jgi:ribulose-bisphosphate carboxylase large chain